jgi:NADPH:quinone reductase-like Zn-dependent oxidoreductase
MKTNEAAWLKNKFERLSVASASFSEPTGKEVLVEVHAVAINPVDRLIQKMGGFLYGWLKYPAILGIDLAGEVAAVGPEVTRFKVGDRVLALAVGVEKSQNRAAEGAFQKFALVLEHLAAAIPPSLSYEQATVLPLGISTAASGMFQRDSLALQAPAINPVPNGQTFLVWGGSTSVGTNAIQLAVQAGYTVIATASPKNHAAVRKLGASQVFDYNSGTAVRDIKNALKGRAFAGAIAIGANSASACIDIAGGCTGKRFVAIATFPVDLEAVPERAEGFAIIRRIMPKAIPAFLGLFFKAAAHGVKTKFIWGSSLKDNEVSKIIFEDFLPAALRSGAYTAVPSPLMAGHGLEAIQVGFDMLKQGVSAQKVVVSL